jgi:hypothetical protein
LEDTAPDFSKTMAALDRELGQGERFVSGLDRLNQFASPFRALLRAVAEGRPRGTRDASATDERV